MKVRSLLPSLVVFTAMAAASCGPSSAIVVPGTSDPWLAGMPDGTLASINDSAPGQSPVLATGFTLTPGGILTFAATGSVNNVPGPSGLTPDGGGFQGHFTGAENGISDLNAPLTSLVGVFLDASQPDSTPAPAALDFSTAPALDYVSLSPLLKQVFFIGDGVNSASIVQEVVIPTGATRLYLGTMDGFEWNNNYGEFDVSITNSGGSPVPEPGSVALLAASLPAMVGVRLRKQARR
jgi:hypothetical protein